MSPTSVGGVVASAVRDLFPVLDPA
ncbi:uncharacterized protein METZ01_LOCUS38431 [marine metagenome]|uniref:Uncharacterized protein n=1 Tax=marine metagenome TaxID=408172 RepID=A0A381R6T1_9ZZZZ